MYYSEIPTKLNPELMNSKSDWVKARTQELYDMLPQTTLEERNSYTDIRDEIIELNYSFFGYVARDTFVADPLVAYDDKVQSAVTHFCQMWAKYKFTPKVGKKYRTDLSFAVFFKPRLSECIKRELSPIKYSLRRTVCMKAAAQLGKHWGQLTKEDIQHVHLNPQEMQILEAIFNIQNNASYEDDNGRTHYLAKSKTDFIVSQGIDDIYTEQYDDLEDLIVHEMIEQESKLDDAYLLKMSEMYGIPFVDLVNARPLGEQKLKYQLEEVIDIKDTFESDIGYKDVDEVED